VSSDRDPEAGIDGSSVEGKRDYTWRAACSACLAAVHVTDGIAPGIIQLLTGAWYDLADPEEETPLCARGNPNVLTRDVGTSSFAQGCTG
jgi:biotin/methionine sulfoxide reductase